MAADRFLVIDTSTGTLWSLPASSSITAPFVNSFSVEFSTFASTYISARRDSTTFLNADFLCELAGQTFDAAPFTVILEGTGPDSAVYCVNVQIKNARWEQWGKSFLFPYSFSSAHNRYEAISAILDDALPAPLRPTLDESRVYPHPRAILGARQVTDLEELSCSEREFYLSATVAPYIFRDCTNHLEDFWRSARRHKEHHPRRMALAQQLVRNSELQKIQRVNALLVRTDDDPAMQKAVASNAKNGLRVLTELLQPANGAAAAASAHTKPTHFFGPEGLPAELQEAVFASFFESLCASVDTNAVARSACAMRATCTLFCDAARIGDGLLDGAAETVRRFVELGVPLGPERPVGSWSYREFACHPSLLWNARGRHDPGFAAYLKRRYVAQLAPAICNARAFVHQSSDPKSIRLQRLRRIVG